MKATVQKWMYRLNDQRFSIIYNLRSHPLTQESLEVLDWFSDFYHKNRGSNEYTNQRIEVCHERVEEPINLCNAKAAMSPVTASTDHAATVFVSESKVKVKSVTNVIKDLVQNEQNKKILGEECAFWKLLHFNSCCRLIRRCTTEGVCSSSLLKIQKWEQFQNVQQIKKKNKTTSKCWVLCLCLCCDVLLWSKSRTVHHQQPKWYYRDFYFVLSFVLLFQIEEKWTFVNSKKINEVREGVSHTYFDVFVDELISV